MNDKIKKLTELRNSMWEPELKFGCEITLKVDDFKTLYTVLSLSDWDTHKQTEDTYPFRRLIVVWYIKNKHLDLYKPDWLNIGDQIFSDYDFLLEEENKKKDGDTKILGTPLSIFWVLKMLKEEYQKDLTKLWNWDEELLKNQKDEVIDFVMEHHLQLKQV